jgi:hypothetical protein
MGGRLNQLLFFIFLFYCLIAVNTFGQEKENFFILPFGYDFLRLGEQNIHSPAIGLGFLIGEQDIPFTQVERRYFGMALYQPFFFQGEQPLGVTKQFHQIDAIFDGRINRHQLLFIFKSAADKPVAGGLSTFQAGIGYGYEVIRQPHISLILGGALGVSDFGLALPLLPLPLIRFGIDTQWFVSSFDFLTGPNFSFTVAPKERVRFTADMRMDNYRSINDLIYEYTFWYRIFSASHQMGDFVGVGIGVKNDSVDFVISRDDKNFELQQTSVFAALDLSIIRLEGGWVFASRYLIDGEKTSSPGRGFYLSLQGIIPIKMKN